MIERHRDDAVDMTAEVRVRLYQPSSEPLEVEQIQALVGRAVEMFLLGVACGQRRFNCPRHCRCA